MTLALVFADIGSPQLRYNLIATAYCAGVKTVFPNLGDIINMASYLVSVKNSLLSLNDKVGLRVSSNTRRSLPWYFVLMSGEEIVLILFNCCSVIPLIETEWLFKEYSNGQSWGYIQNSPGVKFKKFVFLFI